MRHGLIHFVPRDGLLTIFVPDSGVPEVDDPNCLAFWSRHTAPGEHRGDWDGVVQFQMSARLEYGVHKTLDGYSVGSVQLIAHNLELKEFPGCIVHIIQQPLPDVRPCSNDFHKLRNSFTALQELTFRIDSEFDTGKRASLLCWMCDGNETTIDRATHSPWLGAGTLARLVVPRVPDSLVNKDLHLRVALYDEDRPIVTRTLPWHVGVRRDVLAPLCPIVVRIIPPRGRAGDLMMVCGAHFCKDTCRVVLGDANCRLVRVEGEHVTLLVPPRVSATSGTDPVDLVVYNADVQDTHKSAFTYE